MKSITPAVAALGLMAAGCASSSAMTRASAPQPLHAVANPDSFYSGTWHEIARNPQSITDGCVAGVTAFSRTEDGGLFDRDSCRVGSPVDGKEKVFAGPARILDPVSHAKFHTDYRVFGIFHVGRTYWVLDNGSEGGGWFVGATPDLKNLSIFTRGTHPPQALINRLVSQSQAMGFAGKLEFPAQP